MKLTEKEINNAIQNAINEYGDNYSYPTGADNSSAPWNQVDNSEYKDYYCSFPTAQTLLAIADEFLEIKDTRKLELIKNACEKLPKEFFISATYNVPYEFDTDEDGYYKSDAEEDAELIRVETGFKDERGYIYDVPSWMEKHSITVDEETMSLIKKVDNEIYDYITDIKPRPCDFDLDAKCGDIKNFGEYVYGYDMSNIGKSDAQEQNVMNESAMRNLIYEKVLKALNECCK